MEITDALLSLIVTHQFEIALYVVVGLLVASFMLGYEAGEDRARAAISFRASQTFFEFACSTYRIVFRAIPIVLGIVVAWPVFLFLLFLSWLARR